MTDKVQSTCTLKTAYKKTRKKYQDIRGNVKKNINQKNQRKNKPRTNAGNAMPVCRITCSTKGRPRRSVRSYLGVGHAEKSIWWMPWH